MTITSQQITTTVNPEYWVRRSDQRGKWHIVESEIADRAIVKCGKQMDHLNAAGYDLEWRFLRPNNTICLTCTRRTPSITP